MGATELDKLYFLNTDFSLSECLNLFDKQCIEYRLALDYNTARSEAQSSEISAHLFQQYAKNLRKAVDNVFQKSDNTLPDQLRANVTRFAAYKAYHATQKIKDSINDTTGELPTPRAVFNAFNRYQAAEYNTATARARTAKQWQQFSASERINLFPNLEWIRTRSVTPREQHLAFAGLILPKNHPFWQRNQPGNLWNCKCDWHETDAEPRIPEGVDVNTVVIASAGLNGNPAQTGEIFSNNASYFKRADIFEINKLWKPIENGFKEYIKYRDDTEYNNVEFNWENGCYIATNINHVIGDNYIYEKNAQDIAFLNKHTVILEKETGKGIGEKYFDGIFDGYSYEQGSSLGNGKNNIKDILNHCRKKSADIAVIYFPKKELFSVKRIKDGISKFNGQTNYRFKKIIYIVDNKLYEI